MLHRNVHKVYQPNKEYHTLKMLIKHVKIFQQSQIYILLAFKASFPTKLRHVFTAFDD